MRRQTKIIATLGPASASPETVRALVDAGVQVFRLNFSHGSHADHLEYARRIRNVEDAVGRPLTILADLQGPKFRIGRFAEGSVRLANGDIFDFDDLDLPGTASRVRLPHPAVHAALVAGSRLLVDDGRLSFHVLSNAGGVIRTRVECGGTLSDRKGVNLPDATLQQSVLTPKDREDLAVALALQADWIALSFVQSAADVIELRELVRGRALIVAKIEKPQAVANLASILDVADGLMIARGDLAVETAAEDVPVLQRHMVNECRNRGKPVIVATQMLESMTSAPVPTRAEASDVATAVYQGADAVMLSAETASGAHPLAAVQIMDKIIQRVEADLLAHPTAVAALPMRIESDMIGAALRVASEATLLAAAVTYTTGGASASKMARERPRCPLVAVTPSIDVARRLGLTWGVRPWLSRTPHGADELVQVAKTAAAECVPEAQGGFVAIVAGMPFGTRGALNFFHVVSMQEGAY